MILRYHFSNSRRVSIAPSGQLERECVREVDGLCSGQFISYHNDPSPGPASLSSTTSFHSITAGRQSSVTICFTGTLGENDNTAVELSNCRNPSGFSRSLTPDSSRTLASIGL